MTTFYPHHRYTGPNGLVATPRDAYHFAIRAILTSREAIASGRRQTSDFKRHATPELLDAGYAVIENPARGKHDPSHLLVVAGFDFEGAIELRAVGQGSKEELDQACKEYASEPFLAWPRKWNEKDKSWQ